jgi:hypothetical protein
LANSLAAGLSIPRVDAAGLVAALGLPADVRAERVAPAEFVRLAQLIFGCSATHTRAECSTE